MEEKRKEGKSSVLIMSHSSNKDIKESKCLHTNRTFIPLNFLQKHRNTRALLCMWITRFSRTDNTDNISKFKYADISKDRNTGRPI